MEPNPFVASAGEATRNYRPAATVEAVQAAHAAKLLAMAKMRQQLVEFECDLAEAEKIEEELNASMLAKKREQKQLSEPLSEIPNPFVGEGTRFVPAMGPTVSKSLNSESIVVAGGDLYGKNIPAELTGKSIKQTLLKLSPGKGLGIVADEDMCAGDIAGIYVALVSDSDGQAAFWSYNY